MFIKMLSATGNNSMLYISRLGFIAAYVYKALHEISPKYLQDMIENKSDFYYYRRALSSLTQMMIH